MTQAEQIYWKHSNSPKSIWKSNREISIAAITEALNVNADKVKNLEEENKRLREGIVKAFNDGVNDSYNVLVKGHEPIYNTGQNYYNKTFTNEQQTD